RCNYIRVNTNRKILVGTQDTNSANPNQPPAGQPVQAGVTFHDVSNPQNPQLLGFYQTRANGATHGFEIDDRFVYACATTPESKPGTTQEVEIITYSTPGTLVPASTLKTKGKHVGEPSAPQAHLNKDATPKFIQCHEINLKKNRLYVAWRDAGLVIVD